MACNWEPSPANLVRTLALHLAQEPLQHRQIIAIAGPPGSGKTTLTEILKRLLEEEHGPVSLLPMDGFHLHNSTLQQLGKAAIKGHPSTFDSAAYLAFLERAHRSGTALAAPVFDHGVGEPVDNALPIPPEAQVILTEGNYLLSRDFPWAGIRQHCSATIFLDIPWPVCRERLIARRLSIGQDITSTLDWVDRSDQANYAYVMDQSDRSGVITVKNG